MESISFNIGEVIRTLRKDMGVTQEALSQAMGVSVQAVSKWETGQSLPDVALLPALADYFHTSIDALFARTAAAWQVPFPDDGKYRVVQYQGQRLMDAQECEGGHAIRLMVDQDSKVTVDVQGSVAINGDFYGGVTAQGGVHVSGSIMGGVSAGETVSCEGNIMGGVTSGQCADSASSILHSVHKAVSGLSGALGGLFGSGSRKSAQVAFSGELPDDDVLRVVQVQGRRILDIRESANERVIRLAVDHVEGQLCVEVYGSAAIQGNVSGDVSAGDGMTCGNVTGDASAGDSLYCGDVGGDVSAGDSVTCGNVQGDVSAGDSVTCADVSGDVSADAIRHGARRGAQANADTADGIAVDCPQKDVLYVVQAMNGQVLDCQAASSEQPIYLALEDADGIAIFVQGNARIEGSVEGNVSADGSVMCGDVEGDVRADGSVTCGDVSGDAQAGGRVTCGDVSGDVQAGGDMICGSVEGDVHAQGAFHCDGDIEGDVYRGC